MGKERGPLILDGATGTELELQGYDVSGHLWSAKYLLDQPEVLAKLHLQYLEAGSDLLLSASYQASVEGLASVGLTKKEALAVIGRSVRLAKETIENFWQGLTAQERVNRPYPLVGGSVGPYAAYLADGSEYTGRYQVDKDSLKAFHRSRIQALLAAGADFLAIETIPNREEVQALVELLSEEFPGSEAYLSFVTRNGDELSDGTPIELVGQLVSGRQEIVAVGVNCCRPDDVSELLRKLKSVTNQALLAYPNSGEVYDGQKQTWIKASCQAKSLADYGWEWWQSIGVAILGGCCRTRPCDIRDLAEKFK